MNKPLHILRRPRGFTIIELMIALALSLLLASGVAQVYSSTKQTYNLQEAQSRLQENGRLAMYLLTRDIRMSDFWGCLRDLPGSLTNNLDTTSSEYDPNSHTLSTRFSGIDGFNDGANPALDASDALILSGAFNDGLVVKPPYMPNTSSDLKVSDDSELNENDIVLVSDCTGGDIFQITNDPLTGGGQDDQVIHNTGTVSAGPGNATSSLSKTYAGDAHVFKLAKKIYSIGNGASGEPALFVKDNGVDQELVEGVENMQILYGEDTDGDGAANYYVDADSVVDMGRVLSVKISLLVRSLSPGNITTQSITYNYNGGQTTALDKQMRKVFSSTISIRNRLS